MLKIKPENKLLSLIGLLLFLFHATADTAVAKPYRIIDIEKGRKIVIDPSSPIKDSKSDEILVAVKVLAAEITYGPKGEPVPLRLSYGVRNDAVFSRIFTIYESLFQGQDLQTGKSDILRLEPSARELIFRVKKAHKKLSYWLFVPDYDTRQVFSDGLNAILLSDGENLTEALQERGIHPPIGKQKKINELITPYLDENSGRVMLKENQHLLLFELGTSASNSYLFDMQDLVLLIEFQ